MSTIAGAREQWSPEGVYLNTASYGLPPRDGFDALQRALADWRCGRTSWEHWGESAEGARAAFAAMVGGPADAGRDRRDGVGVRRDGGRRACPPARACSSPTSSSPRRCFRSSYSRRRAPRAAAGSSSRPWRPTRLAEAIDARTDVVAFSAVQMSTGEVADSDAIVAAARHHGALTLLDATQACGWLPVDATRFGAVVCSAYKWLMSPRGTSFMAVGDEWLERIVPHSAGWYAGADVHASYFGPPLRLASDARRLDTSPAWFSWVGTQPALELLNRIGIDAVYAHNVALANRFRAGLGLEPSNSAIVSADVPDGADRLERAGIVAALRGGRLRVSWHVYNTERDVDVALGALAG